MASPPSLSFSDMLKERHGDLARKYQIHATQVEQIWRSFDKNQREACLGGKLVDGFVLGARMETNLLSSILDKLIVPEMHVENIVRSGPDSLLELLEFRATTSLLHQFKSGMRGGQGDCAFIQEINSIPGVISDLFKGKHCWYSFADDDGYGTVFMPPAVGDLSFSRQAIKEGSYLPHPTAHMVLERQMILVQTLGFIIGDILREGSKTRDLKKPKKPTKPTTLSTIVHISSEKPTLHDLLATANDQRDTYEECLTLLSAEPSLLFHLVRVKFWARPELVCDERGSIIPVTTDKYISPAFFEAIVSVNQGVATWQYIGRLLGLLDSPTAEKKSVARATILQELSNVCHAEYNCMRGLFQRIFQNRSGFEWFERIAGAVDKEGNARVRIKGDPATLTRTNPQFHYALRLCQPGTSASQAFEWASKLDNLHNRYPEEREKLKEVEDEALCDLVSIIGFIHDLSQVIELPPPSDRKGRIYASEYQNLKIELDKLKHVIDVRDFAAPIEILQEPDMAEAALKTLESFVIKNAGKGLGSLHRDLVDGSVQKLQDKYLEAAKALMAPRSEAPGFINTPPEATKKVGGRRRKQKSRPITTSTSTHELLAPGDAGAAGLTDRLASFTVAEPAATPTFEVSSATASVFSTVFGKSESRGSIDWTAFESAMADLGFSVLPKFGSVYTFFPPDSMGVNKSFTMHRPHKSEIEGVFIPILARRLRRVYGWEEKSFELA